MSSVTRLAAAALLFASLPVAVCAQPAPGPGPQYGDPGPGPQYGAPGQDPQYGAPPPGPQYGAPGPGPQYGAPGPGPQYGAPGPGPQYGDQGQGPQYGAPGPQYGAPGPQYPPGPQYGAPGPQYGGPAGPPPGPAYGDQFSANEVLNAGTHVFGGVSRGLAMIVQKATSQWGLPNGYIVGEEAGGAFVGGLRYGDGTLYTKNAGDRKVFWQGPTVGFDAGADGARTMMLVYNLPRTDAVFDRFVGLDGSAYFVGGLGMTAMTARGIVLVPIRAGIGVRLGASVGYLKFTPRPTWNPF